MTTSRIDWLGQFESKFGQHELISSLAKDKFHGKLVVNFVDGVPSMCHMEWFVKPFTNLTSTKGE